MIGEEWPIVADLLGLGADNVALWQMAIRAVIVYLAAIVLVRVGEKRFLGKYAALDVILGFMLGSVLSRAITASAPFFETILGGALSLVLIHWLFAVLSFHSDRFGDLVKGTDRVLVRDGDILWDKMQTSHISEQDLLSAVRTNAQIANVEQVKEARLERSGDISVIEREEEPRVVEIDVQDGVQVVRLQIG
ncbi:MAG TPA: YetF domain-containing protein [Candidatus Sulfomarinibacteraceae bacterium]|nr:YetF domain-containing protein [Candidatus Sulfomarinibacteraceae bacterium]